MKKAFLFNGAIKISLKGPLWMSDIKAAQGNITYWQQMEARDKCLRCNDFSRQKSDRGSPATIKAKGLMLVQLSQNGENSRRSTSIQEMSVSWRFLMVLSHFGGPMWRPEEAIWISGASLPRNHVILSQKSHIKHPDFFILAWGSEDGELFCSWISRCWMIFEREGTFYSTLHFWGSLCCLFWVEIISHQCPIHCWNVITTKSAVLFQKWPTYVLSGVFKIPD